MSALLKINHMSRAITMIAVAGSVGLASIANAQDFSSGSDGSDGALDFTGADPGSVIQFDPYSYDPPLDADQDGIFHFTTITIPENVTVQLSSTLFGGVPVIWLATGDVVIAGTLDLSGEDGYDWDSGQRRFSIPGPGGFGGGVGELEGLNAESGLGPGGSKRHGAGVGNGAGHARAGNSNGLGGGTLYGLPYGNPFLQPLIGGSGAAGGYDNNSSANTGAGGGAGGGAVLIASSASIQIEGSIDVSGGNGGMGPVDTDQYRGGHGGGGSGGAIRLVAPQISGSGSLVCNGGDGSRPFPSGTGSGSEGYIRVEGRIVSHGLTFQPDGKIVPLSPQTPLLPEQSPSAVRIVQIDGQDVEVTPGGSILNPDIVLDNPSPVEVVIAASGIPIGTQLTLSIFSVELGEITATSTPLEGTLDSSTATATIQFPPTISQMFVRATWTP